MSISPTRAHDNWNKVLTKLRPIAKGCLKPNAILMCEDHWCEAHKINLIFGELQLTNHLHPKTYWPFRKSYKVGTFNEHIQKVIDLFKYDLMPNYRVVEPLNHRALASLEVTFGEDGELIMANSHLAHWTTAIKQNIQVESFGAFALRPKMEPLLLPEGSYIFILDCQKILRIGYKAMNMQHTSLSQWGAVLVPGYFEIVIEDGKNYITSFSNESGHYRPSNLVLKIIEKFLRSKGAWNKYLSCSKFDLCLSQKLIQNSLIK